MPHIRELITIEGEFNIKQAEKTKSLNEGAANLVKSALRIALENGVLYPESVLEVLESTDPQTWRLYKAVLEKDCDPRWAPGFLHSVQTLARTRQSITGEIQTTGRFLTGMQEASKMAQLIGGFNEVHPPHLVLGMVEKSYTYELIREHLPNFRTNLRLAVLDYTETLLDQS